MHALLYFICRYLEANITMSAGWRKPMEYVPAALHNRPLHLIKHMKEVGIKADLISPGSISRQSNRLFSIKGKIPQKSWQDLF